MAKRSTKHTASKELATSAAGNGETTPATEALPGQEDAAQGQTGALQEVDEVHCPNPDLSAAEDLSERSHPPSLESPADKSPRVDPLPQKRTRDVRPPSTADELRMAKGEAAFRTSGGFLRGLPDKVIRGLAGDLLSYVHGSQPENDEQVLKRVCEFLSGRKQ